MSSVCVRPFYDETTCTFSYVIYSPDDSFCAVIDPVLDYDPKAAQTSTRSADQIITYLRENGLTVQWLLETHAHADHLSAASYLRTQLGGITGIGEHIVKVQVYFKRLYNLGQSFTPDGSQFDHLFTDGATFYIGDIKVTVLHVPGHTPADIAYMVEGAGIFVGDTLFLPDVGTARCDFPGGNVNDLYESIQRLLSFGDQTKLFMCHDYPPNSRAAQHCTTVLDQRQHNIHVCDSISQADFVAMRAARDKTLEMPDLILPAIQVNIRAGVLPPPETNGVQYLKIPINQL